MSDQQSNQQRSQQTLFFQQLFEPVSSTYTYLLADMDTREAILIDSVLEKLERDLKLIKDLELNLRYLLETHIHADHITGAGKIADATGAKICVSAEARASGVDIALKHGDQLTFSTNHRIDIIASPGHTNSCMCFFIAGRLFTGDALMIRGNGRTDFQEGSAETLYHSIHERIFKLPDEILVYPAHDYNGFTSSTIGIEKRLNPRVGQRSLSEFVDIMKNLNLAPPKKIHEAVPANLKCGRV